MGRLRYLLCEECQHAKSLEGNSLPIFAAIWAHMRMHIHSSKVPRNWAVLLQHKGLTSLLDTYRHDSDLYKLSKLPLVSNTGYKMKVKDTIALSDRCQNAHSPHYFPYANPQQWQQPGMSGRTVPWHCSIFYAPSHKSKRLFYHIC